MLLLVADDNPEAAETLAELLRLRVEPPVEVIVAFDGRQALALATGPPIPDAVIMDIEMPVMDGVSAAIEIWHALGSRSPLLIAATGRADMVEGTCLRSAFDHALSKPLNVDNLLALLRPASRACGVGGLANDEVAAAVRQHASARL